MNKILSTLAAAALLTSGALPAYAQFGSFSDVPIEITADGETRFEGGVAVAEDNVAISYGNTYIFCDYAQYNPDSKDVLLRGNIRLFRDDYVFTGDRAVYNLETKTLRAADFEGASEPFLFGGENLSSIGSENFRVDRAVMTTHDAAVPSWHFRAKSVRIYPGNRIIFSNVTMVIGTTPVFWWPYLFQSLDKDMAFSITPGYSNDWGLFVLTSYTFPISDDASATLRLDGRSERGFAAGLDLDFKLGSDPRSFSELVTYVAFDSDPTISTTGGTRPGDIDDQRFRVSYQSQTYFTEDIYLSTDINYLSDQFLLEDFYQSEFTLDPQPDNVVTLTKWDENYTINAITRFQLNDFQTTTERLPEIVLDIKRQNFFGTPVFYESQTGLAQLSISGGNNSLVRNIDTGRFDTFHQFTYPRVYGGWFSFIPRAGFRATYYTDTFGAIDEDTALPSTNGGADYRLIFNTGFEASTKFTKDYGDIRFRPLGLDGLRHVFQPYTNFSFVADSGMGANEVFQIDRLIPSTEIPPIDFPQFTSIDSIDNWTVWRLGMRNRFYTNRDGAAYLWLDMDTFFDVNIENPYTNADLSNLVNRVRWYPMSWLALSLDTQVPLDPEGFAVINSQLNFMVTKYLDINIGQRFLSDSPFFEDSNLFFYGGYWQINDNWGFSMNHRFEAQDSTLEYQEYMLHRDLTSWVASLGAVIRDNRKDEELDWGFLLTFTLKDFPKLNLPFNFEPQGGSQ